MFPKEPGEDHGGAGIHTAAHGELHTGTGGHGPKEAASMESPHRNRALEEAVVPGRENHAGAGLS